MKSSYSFEKKNGYLYLVISGEYAMTDFLLYPKLIKEECEKQQVYKVMFDGLSVKGIATVLDKLLLGKEVAKTLGRKIKIAAVWQAEHITVFFETVAGNRGARVSVFGDVEAAKNWLLNTPC